MAIKVPFFPLTAVLLLGGISSFALAGGYSLPEDAGEEVAAVNVRVPELTEDQAHQLAGLYEQDLAEGDEQNPLRSPDDLDDVLDILRTDRLDLFSAGAALAEDTRGIEAMVLHAQIQLAWGEALRDMAVLHRGAAEQGAEALNKRAAATGGGGGNVATDPVVQSLAKDFILNTLLGASLGHCANDHAQLGAQLAVKVNKKQPDSYTSYRLLADYLALAEQWSEFDKAVEVVQKLKPDSTGLLFLQGVAAASRDGDPVAADRYFEKALAADPQFTRARVWQFSVAKGEGQTCSRWRPLQEMAPRHQMVVRAGKHWNEVCGTAGGAASELDALVKQADAAIAATPAQVAPDRATTLAAVEKRLAAASPEAAKSPASVEDVVAVLHADRLDLFRPAVAWADAQNTLEGRALAAQIELAWGEGLMDTAALLTTAVAEATSAEDEERHLEALRLAGAGKDDASDLTSAIDARVAESLAMRAEGVTRLRSAHARVQTLLAEAPDDYRVHRIAADYYRIRNDWDAFQVEVDRTAALKPDSNGLRFQRGLAALARDQDPDKGTRLLQEALAVDPAFTRARAQILLYASSDAARCAALADLRTHAPAHAYVVVAGDLLGQSCPAAGG